MTIKREDGCVREARVCMKCGRTEVGWRYNRCPNCGEMADEQAAPEPLVTPAELRGKAQLVDVLVRWPSLSADSRNSLREVSEALRATADYLERHVK